MGRGRAKAKQTKVARELKYYSPSTDYTALERELHQSSSGPPSKPSWAEEADDDIEEYDDYDKWASGGR